MFLNRKRKLFIRLLYLERWIVRPEATGSEVNSIVRSINVKIPDVVVVSIVGAGQNSSSEEVIVIRIEIEDDIFLLQLRFLTVYVIF